MQRSAWKILLVSTAALAAGCLGSTDPVTRQPPPYKAHVAGRVLFKDDSTPVFSAQVGVRILRDTSAYRWDFPTTDELGRFDLLIGRADTTVAIATPDTMTIRVLAQYSGPHTVRDSATTVITFVHLPAEPPVANVNVYIARP